MLEENADLYEDSDAKREAIGWRRLIRKLTCVGSMDDEEEGSFDAEGAAIDLEIDASRDAELKEH